MNDTKILGRREKVANIIIGFIFIVLGAWGIMAHWWGFLDLLRVVLPSALVIVGIIAIIAGLKK